MVRYSPRLFAIALLLAACSAPPSLPALSPEGVILAFGDSLTYGSGAARDESYPAVLQRLTGHTVVNAGVPGEVTDKGVARLPGVLDEAQPELLILCLGGNDMLRRHDAAVTRENLRLMVRMARQRGIAVVLLAVPKPGLMMHPPDYYEMIGDEFAIPVETDVLPDVLAERSLKSDTIHPNAKGYRVMAEAVFDLLRERGAIRK